MIVIYGTRNYGRIREHGGEYAVTRFAHVYYMPLLPVRAVWMGQSSGGQPFAIASKMSLKSVAAGYARTWGIIGGAGLAIAGASHSIGAAVVGCLGVAAGLGSFMWSRLRASHEIRRSDLLEAAVGVRCPPELMTRELATTHKDALEQRWAAVATDRSPSDVARFGPANPMQGAIAYSLLAVGAELASGQVASSMRADAAKIAAQMHETSTLGEGPYRGGLPDGSSAAPPVARVE